MAQQIDKTKHPNIFGYFLISFIAAFQTGSTIITIAEGQARAINITITNTVSAKLPFYNVIYISSYCKLRNWPFLISIPQYIHPKK